MAWPHYPREGASRQKPSATVWRRHPRECFGLASPRLASLLTQLQAHPLVLPLVRQALEGLHRLVQLAGGVHEALIQAGVVDELAGGAVALVDLVGDALEAVEDAS